MKRKTRGMNNFAKAKNARDDKKIMAEYLILGG